MSRASYALGKVHDNRYTFKQRCKRDGICVHGCRRGEPCARLPERLRLPGDRPLVLIDPADVELPEGWWLLRLEPTGGAIAVRGDEKLRIFDATPAGLAHLSADELELYRRWDNYHDRAELLHDGVDYLIELPYLKPEEAA